MDTYCSNEEKDIIIREANKKLIDEKKLDEESRKLYEQFKEERMSLNERRKKSDG